MGIQEKNVRQIAFSELLPFRLIMGNCFGTSNSNELSSKNIKRKEVIDTDIIYWTLDNTDSPQNQNSKTNLSKEKSKGKKKTTANVSKAKNSKVNVSKLQPNSHTTSGDAGMFGSEDNFGLPEPDEEYLRGNADIWKMYLADRKRKMNQQIDHDKK